MWDNMVLDTTIRDGSYAIDFKFSLPDVENICRKLDKLGIGYIEIGHGMGLNASSQKNGLSLHSDVEYMRAARDSVKNSMFGFFCIPGIARLEDLDTAKENGVGFIRVGINVDEAERTLEYIEYAKKLGFIVMANLMKSYIVSPDIFTQKALLCQQCGADYVYVVDSAGCMLPEQLTEIYNSVREKSDVKLGFHGHNNMGLAVANSLHCIKLGFSIVDSSFQGLGRSAGNAPTEQVIMALDKMGLNDSVDIPCLLEYGYTSLRDITDKNLVNPLKYICGYSGFHSGYLKYIYSCCSRYKVDPLRLIIAYSKHNQKSMDYDDLCNVAKTLPEDPDKHPYNFNNYFLDPDL